MKWAAVVLCASVSACTCGGGGGNPDGGDDGPLTAETFCEKSARRYCGAFERCGRMGADLTDRCVADERAECQATARLAASGGVSFDETLARKCIEALDRYPCGVEGLTPPECELPRFFKPAGTIGKPCTLGSCAEGYCPSAGTACPVCTQFAAAGAPCASPNACDPTKAFCNAQNQCAALLGDGADCTEGRQCSSGACSGAPPKCGAPAVGASCSTPVCAKGAYCRGLQIDAMGMVTQNGTCTSAVSNGAACTPEKFLSPCLEPDARCLDGSCQVVASFTRTSGQSCGAMSHCAQGTYCAGDAFSGTCQSLVAQSGACKFEGCASGLICSSTAKVCRPVPLENQPCSTMAASCAEQLFCAAGTCKRAGGAGEACSADVPCRDGACVNGTCAAARAEGQECAADSECTSRRCVANGSGQTVCGASCG